MKMKAYECESCNAEITGKKPEKCPLCGRKKFSEFDKEDKKDQEDEKYSKVYKEVLGELEGYVEGTLPEEYKHGFAD